MGSSRGVRRGLVVAMLAGCALLPALAGAAWSGPVDLSAAGQDAYGPQVALDANGDAVAVWWRSDGSNPVVQAASRSRRGTWSTPADLSAAGQDATEQQVALDQKGDAVVVWDRFDGSNFIVQAATRPKGGTWSSPADLSAPGHSAIEPQVALDPKGDAVAVWYRGDGSNLIIQAASRPKGGNWSSPVNLSAPNQDAFEPQVALDQKGDAVAVWDRFDGSDRSLVVQAASRPKGGGWSTASDLSAPEYFFVPFVPEADPHVALDAKGDAVAVWRRNFVIQAANRPKGGNWSTPADLSDPSENNAFAPQIALDRKGDAVAVWYTQAGEFVVRAASRPKGGSWSTPADLSGAGFALWPRGARALDPKGDAVVVWDGLVGGEDTILAASRPKGGSWSTPADLSAPGQTALEPQVALDAKGDAVAVWEGLDAGNLVVQASAGP
jgi:hypothetical protein